jgi:hypothetical protein
MTAKVAFRGGYTCSCVATSLPLLEEIMILNGLVSDGLDLYQLGWRNDVSASAGTHSRGGCTDIGQLSDECLAIERKYGWTFQHRTQAQGFSPHAHGWPNGCVHLAPSAQYQQNAWNNGRDGLVSNGPITGPGPKGRSTPHWTEGVQQMRKDIMAIEDRIAAKVRDELLSAINNSGSTPAEVLNWGGVNVAASGKPINWSAGHILSFLVRVAGPMSAKVNGVDAKVTGLQTELANLTALVQKDVSK